MSNSNPINRWQEAARSASTSNPFDRQRDAERSPTDLVTIRDLSYRYQKSDRHTRRVVAADSFPTPFRIAGGKTLYWHFSDIVDWEKSQRVETEAA
jgi:predicted DNA-binding transcriptional regulator AlpA